MEMKDILEMTVTVVVILGMTMILAGFKGKLLKMAGTGSKKHK